MNTELTTDAVPSADNKRFDPVSIIGTSTACLVALLAIGAFALSYEALRDLAVRTGALPESTAWIFPLLVDGSIIVFSISALRASVIGADKDRRWFLSLVVLVTLASVVLNVCHARGGLLPGIIAALPPLFLFAAFESLMRQLQQSVASVRPAARPKAKKGPSERQSAPPEAETENRKGRALELKETGMTNAAISRELGVSAATVSRYLTSKAV